MTAAMTTDIPVATVDAARRSDAEVLPEHEYRYPADDFVRALVKERYDGTASTNKAIGNELYSDIAGGTYPSWRIEQIARGMGLADEKRAEIIAKSRAADGGERHGSWRTPQLATAQKPVTPPAKTQADPAAAKCEVCGATFEPWKIGLYATRRWCHACYTAKATKAHTGQRKHVDPAPPAPIATPTPPPQLPIVAARDPEPDAPLTVVDLPLPDGVILALLDLLPTNGHWTSARRRKWLAALTATLDLLIEGDDEEAQS